MSIGKKTENNFHHKFLLYKKSFAGLVEMTPFFGEQNILN